jgi:hypothetical protein
VREYYAGNRDVLKESNARKPLYPDLKQVEPGLLEQRLHRDMYK